MNMRFAQRAVIGSAILGTALVAVGGVANAATVKPNQNCSPGTYYYASDNGGGYYSSSDIVHADHNGTNYTASDQYSNTWTGTKSTTVNATFSFSATDLVSTVKADLGISATVSTAISGSHTVTYTIAPHSTLYAQYGAKMQNVWINEYYMSGGCVSTLENTGTGSVVYGQGWNTWTGP
jgi:hypothetical protein